MARMAKVNTKIFVTTSTAYRGPDHCTAPGARALAKRLRGYWAKLGYRVNTSIEPLGGSGKKLQGLYAVRSDMVDGWPVARAA